MKPEYNPQLDICFPKSCYRRQKINIQYILNSLQDMTVYEYTNMFAHIWLVRKFVSVSLESTPRFDSKDQVNFIKRHQTRVIWKI